MKITIEFESSDEAKETLAKLSRVNLDSKEEVEEVLSKNLLDILAHPAVRRFLRFPNLTLPK